MHMNKWCENESQFCKSNAKLHLRHRVLLCKMHIFFSVLTSLLTVAPVARGTFCLRGKYSYRMYSMEVLCTATISYCLEPFSY